MKTQITFLAATVLLVVTGCTALAIGVTLSQRRAEPQAPVVLRSSGPTVESVQQLAGLTSLRIHVADMLTVEQRGWFSGYKGAWVVKGDALYTTDLSRATVSVQGVGSQQMARVELPLPSVDWARVDHQQTRTYEMRKNAVIPIWGVSEEVRDEAMKEAQALVEAAARRPEHRQQAQQKAEQILDTFFASIGYRVQVIWRDAGTGTADVVALANN